MFIVYVTELLGIAETGTYKTALMLEYCGASGEISDYQKIMEYLNELELNNNNNIFIYIFFCAIFR